MTPIKWREKDIKKLRSYVRKFNASITRFEKIHPEYSGWQIPARLTVEGLKKQIKTRADFNYQINRIDRWFRPGARELKSREGFLMTKWEIREVQILQQREKANIEKLKKKYSTSPSVNVRAGLYSKDPDVVLRDIKKSMTRKDVINNYDEDNGIQAWRNFQRELERRSSDSFGEAFEHKVFNSFKKGLNTVFDDNQAQFILDKMEELNITAPELFVMRQRWDIFDLDYVYGPEEQDEKFEAIMLYIDLAVKELREQ